MLRDIGNLYLETFVRVRSAIIMQPYGQAGGQSTKQFGQPIGYYGRPLRRSPSMSVPVQHPSSYQPATMNPTNNSAAGELNPSADITASTNAAPLAPATSSTGNTQLGQRFPHDDFASLMDEAPPAKKRSRKPKKTITTTITTTATTTTATSNATHRFKSAGASANARLDISADVAPRLIAAPTYGSEQPQQREDEDDFASLMDEASAKPTANAIPPKPRQKKTTTTTTTDTADTSSQNALSQRQDAYRRDNMDGRTRQAASQRGEQELYLYDQRVVETLRMYSGSVCPAGFVYVRCENGYMCAGHVHFVSDGEVDAMMEGRRPYGPRIENVAQLFREGALLGVLGGRPLNAMGNGVAGRFGGGTYGGGYGSPRPFW
ncbi:hypothetical protein K431DRAFT_142563 [Polychaeton citri CBS 116435]|uniref:Uncharacterized protein n=1 Tax=Polychaeton citri CBS 116435 TaxID=1314669 RepID=A0A9P4Q1W3_9PEZI|nr:hypothetical protein K431DRAFT_142563 [Polychaeton citri CBS 116435]